MDDLSLILSAKGVDKFVKDLEKAQKAAQKGEISLEEFKNILNKLEPIAESAKKALSGMAGQFNDTQLKNVAKALNEIFNAQVKLINLERKAKKNAEPKGTGLSGRNKIGQAPIPEKEILGKKIKETVDKVKGVTTTITKELTAEGLITRTYKNGEEQKRVVDYQAAEKIAEAEAKQAAAQEEKYQNLINQFNLEQQIKEENRQQAEYKEKANDAMAEYLARAKALEDAEKDEKAFYDNPLKWGLGKLKDSAKEGLKKTGIFDSKAYKGIKKGLEIPNKILGSFKDKLKTIKPGKLLKSFGRIATYRAIRGILSGITNSFKEGLGYIKAINPEVRENLNTINSAFTGIKVAISSISTPLLELVAPFVESLSNELINLANATSLLNAEEKGQDEYFKINKEAIDDYTKSINNLSGQLTELDKFATLSKSTPIFGEMAKITEDDKNELSEYTEKVKGLESIFGGISDIAEGLGDWLVEQIQNDTLDDWIYGIAFALSALQGSFGLVTAAIAGFFALIDPNATTELKIFTQAIWALTAAFLAMSFAKMFAVSGFNLAMTGVVAAIVGSTLAAVIGMVSSAQRSTESTSINSANQSALSISSNIGAGYSSYSNAASGAGTQATITNLPNEIGNSVYNATSQSKSTGSSVGNVYLDKHIVGQIVTDDVYTEGVRSGYWRK